MKNGEIWKDTEGNDIHAHGGWILKVKEWYYWYGENRTGDNFVSVYKTKDFKEFIFCNNVLTAKSRTAPGRIRADAELLKPVEKFGDTFKRGALTRVTDDGRVLANIERPKVLYCKATGKYVMWMHYENGVNYDAASCAVATCDTPDGDFVYHGRFNPFGDMARDCTVFEDGGDAYFIASSRGNADLHIYRLTEDYLNVDKLVRVLFQGEYREAPAVFKRNGQFYMLSSNCTGWRPNQGAYAKTYDGMIDGRWSVLSNFGDDTTFHSQPSFVLPVESAGGTEYYYFGDRWGLTSEEYFTSSYVVLKLRFDADGNPYIEYNDNAELPSL